MFILAISCLTTSNLPSFMDLTFHVPMQYCSLQNRTLLPSPVTSTSLKIGDIENLSMYLLGIGVFPLEKCLFKSSSHFFVRWGFFCLFCFLLLSCLSSLSILRINPLSDRWFTNIYFPPSVGFLFILLIVSFAV